MARARIRILVGLCVFFGAAALGFFFKPSLASESLRVEAEARLSELIGSPVRIRTARVAPGLGLRLEGREVVTWTGADGESALEVDRIRADIRIAPLLFGRLQFSRVAFEGARLRIESDAEGRFSPEPFSGLGAGPEKGSAPAGAETEVLVGPLIRAENFFRALLGSRPFADHLELRNATIVFIDARFPRRLAPPVILALESVHAEYRRHRIRGTNRVTVRARVTDARGERGAMEWEGTRDRNGAIRVAVAVTDLQLDAFAPYVRTLHPEARVEGDLSGAVVFDTASPGYGRLEVDLVGHRFRTVEPREHASTVAAERVAAVGTLEITPQNIRLTGARIRGDELRLEVDGTIARPLRSGSFAQIALAFRDVEVSEVRHLIGWLPNVERDEAEEIVEIVHSGRLPTLRAGGAATVAAWQAFLAGRTRTPPADFFVDATLADTVVTVGDEDRLEDLEGRLWWSGNRAEVQEVRANLNGTPLPVLDVVIENFTNFLAGDPMRRRLRSGGVPLVGVRSLWEWFQPDPDESKPAEFQMALGLTIDTLHHPMFLWPIENAAAVIWDTDSGVHIVTDGGTWAGVPVSGVADWVFEPEERVRVSLVADFPEESTTPGTVGPKLGAERGWAEGTVVLGLRHDGPWQQQHATSRFSARAGTFRFEDVALPLREQGTLAATVELEVGTRDIVPFDLSFLVEGGSVESLASQLELFSGLGTGSVDLAGSFRGALRPGIPFIDGLSGLLDVDASEGAIRRSLPAVVAVALASEAYNPFARREEVRYDRCRTVLEFSDGVMSTTGLSLDGPDLRVFASGTLDLARPPNDIDAQIALYLFRQIDKIIGAIPLVNLLLLGTNENLVGAHFKLTGPWDDPHATSAPLDALASGPAALVEQGPTSLVLQSIPMFMMRGIQAIESMLGLGPDSKKQAVKQHEDPLPSES